MEGAFPIGTRFHNYGDDISPRKAPHSKVFKEAFALKENRIVLWSSILHLLVSLPIEPRGDDINYIHSQENFSVLLVILVYFEWWAIKYVWPRWFLLDVNMTVSR